MQLESIKSQIFQVISQAIPYVKGRDTILLTLENLEIPEVPTPNLTEDANDELTENSVELAKTDREPKKIKQKDNLLKYWPIFFVGTLFTALIYSIVLLIKRNLFKQETLKLEEEISNEYLSESNTALPFKNINVENIVETNSAIPKSLWTPSTANLIKDVDESIRNDNEKLAEYLESFIKEEVSNG